MAASFHRIALIAALILLLSPAARSQSFVWAQSINGSGAPNGTEVIAGTTDTLGNLYTVGGFGGTTTFGGVSLTAVSDLDMFVMKQDSSGATIWVKQVKGLINGGYGGCYGRTVDVDEAGNVFITGTFRDSFDFDPGPAEFRLKAFETIHAFILKLDPAGNFLWVKDIGAQSTDVTIGIGAARLAKDGFLYFAATASGNGMATLDVDPSPVVYNITPGGPGDLLLEKLDSNGNFVWAKQILCDKVISPWSLDFDSAFNVFISGWFKGSADFDPGPGVHTLTAVTGSAPWNTDIFVAKYDSAGNFGWAHSFGTPGDDAAIGSAVDRFGNVLITGSFGGTIDFDPGPGVYNLTAPSTRNLFTLKLKNNSDFAWVKMGGASSGSYSGVDVTTDSTGNVYTIMEINGLCDLDPGPNEYNVFTEGAIQKLDSAGNFVWGAGFGADEPRWIGLDNKDSIYICGDFTGSKDFDPGPDVYTLTASAPRSGFILKLNQTLLPNSIEEASLQTTVSVYPNPSRGIVTFSAPVAIKRIEVTDMTGKAVFRLEPDREKAMADLSGRAAGVYFYEVDCGAGKQRGKLVVY